MTGSLNSSEYGPILNVTTRLYNANRALPPATTTSVLRKLLCKFNQQILNRKLPSMFFQCKGSHRHRYLSTNVKDQTEMLKTKNRRNCADIWGIGTISTVSDGETLVLLLRLTCWEETTSRESPAWFGSALHTGSGQWWWSERNPQNSCNGAELLWMKC